MFLLDARALPLGGLTQGSDRSSTEIFLQNRDARGGPSSNPSSTLARTLRRVASCRSMPRPDDDLRLNMIVKNEVKVLLASSDRSKISSTTTSSSSTGSTDETIALIEREMSRIRHPGRGAQAPRSSGPIANRHSNSRWLPIEQTGCSSSTPTKGSASDPPVLREARAGGELRDREASGGRSIRGTT